MDQEGLAYPPSDEEAFLFLGSRRNSQIEVVQAAYTIFFKHVFDEVQKLLEGRFRRSASTYTALSSSWRTYLETEDVRTNLYKSVVKASNKEYYKRTESLESTVRTTSLETILPDSI